MKKYCKWAKRNENGAVYPQLLKIVGVEKGYSVIMPKTSIELFCVI